MNQSDISKRVISRLSRYRDALLRLKAQDIATVFSEDLAAAIGNNAAQVRKDFSCTGICGKKKAGYDVKNLLKQLDSTLRSNERHPVVLAGLGKIGTALLEEGLFDHGAFQVEACFHDNDGTPQESAHSQIPMFPISRLLDYVRDRQIRIGIIAGRAKQAQRVLDLMALAGIRGVLNFTQAELKSPKICIVNTINLLHELENLVFFARAGNEKNA